MSEAVMDGLDIEFRYYEPNELADPTYHIYVDGHCRGHLFLVDGIWCAGVLGDVEVIEAVADKLRELDAVLAESKRSFWE